MARPRSAAVADLLFLLQSGDPMSSAELVSQLGISRPLLSRLVAEAGEQVIRFGNTRATAYVATERSRPNNWALYRMGADATPEPLGTLHALRGERFLFQPSGQRPNLVRAVEAVSGHFPGIPWFLDDVRPQGFLGRTLAHRNGKLMGVPEDLLSWRTADNLIGIQHGGTGIGDLLLGSRAVDQALEQLQNPPDAVAIEQRLDAYARMARDALAGEDVGSSPGGEQPKFTATVQDGSSRYAAIVKFAVSARWADLLAMEHLALRTLAVHGVPAAVSTLLQDGGLTYLELQRFDRTHDVLGRRGFVSLMSLDAAFTGEGRRSWAEAGRQLQALRLIDVASADRMALLHWFGQLIGNSDMHQGNLGFELVDDGPLPLCPAYDMLPMYLAPPRSGAEREPVAIAPRAPEQIGQGAVIARAAAMAIDFWEQVAGSGLIADAVLCEVARRNREVVATYAARFGR